MSAIKTRNFSLSNEKRNHVMQHPLDLGWAPGYEGKSEGIQTPAGKIRYGKGYSLMMGECAKCEHRTGIKKPAGRHCDLPDNEECIF